MISGKKSTFAIEYDIDAQHGGEWLFGKICYWIEDIQLGDYDTGTSLRDLRDFMQGVVDLYDKIFAPELFNIPDYTIFEMIDSAIFDDSHELDKYLCNELQIEMPGIFLITPPVDVFDGCRAYIIGGIRHDKIVYKIEQNSVVKSIQIGKEIIKNVFFDFSKQINLIDIG